MSRSHLPVLLALIAGLACQKHSADGRLAIERLKASTPQERAAGAAMLANLSGIGEQFGQEQAVVQALIELLDDNTNLHAKDFQTSPADEAQKALAALKPAPLEALIAALPGPRKQDEWYVTVRIIKILGQIGDPRGVPPLIALVQKDNLYALEALGEIRDPRVVDALVDVLRRTTDAHFAWRALVSLKKLGGDPKATDTLLALLHGPEPARFRQGAGDPLSKDGRQELRKRVAECLGAKAFKEPRVVEALIAVLDEPDIDVLFRSQVADSLMDLTGKEWGKRADGVWTTEDAYARDPAKWREWWQANKDSFARR